MPVHPRRTAGTSLVAALLLCAWVLPLGLTHGELDDLVCDPALVQHDASAHRIDAPKPRVAGAHHCVLCHWLGSLRLPALARLRTALVLTAADRLLDAADPLLGDPAYHPLPARAPPA